VANALQGIAGRRAAVIRLPSATTAHIGVCGHAGFQGRRVAFFFVAFFRTGAFLRTAFLRETLPTEMKPSAGSKAAAVPEMIIAGAIMAAILTKSRRVATLRFSFFILLSLLFDSLVNVTLAAPAAEPAGI
jgi:hypothetical protein